jgi:hypothetical protein
MTTLKVMDRIAKLLAQAESTTHEAEAETAKNLAATLMAKHQISAIEAKDEDQFHEIQRNLYRKTHLKYDTVLRNCLSDYCGVQYYRRTRHHGACDLFVGRECDLENFFYLEEIVYAQREAEWKRYTGFSKRSEWLLGFAYGVCSKLNELKDKENNVVREHGLVPVSMADQASSWFEDNNKVNRTKSRTGQFSSAGYEAGTKASLNKAATAPQTTKQIGG